MLFKTSLLLSALVAGAVAFDCGELPDGNYTNPEDCTTFISCSNGQAFIMDCPYAGVGVQLYFNPTTNRCDVTSCPNED
jgi:hypothetical protein